MNDSLQDLMREATRLTRSGRLMEATAAIQRALGGTRPAGDVPGTAPGDVLDGCVSEVDAPPRASVERGRFEHGRLARDYRLFVPPSAGRDAPLVVMLHGCTQDPDDFAAGTTMDVHAQRGGFCVLYPAQAPEANPQRCWNWFKHHHQQRGRGEAALIAALASRTAQERGLDASRVYVAGLSAGGAMAALLGAAYPDVFAAVGVHSGLAPGVATSLPQALAAMRGEPGAPARPLPLPTIVFHGDRDATVAPANADRTVAAALAGRDGHAETQRGPRHTRTIHRDAQGRVIAEQWTVHGGGHAWSGGSPAGSFTDSAGPDASDAMLGFFLTHRRDGAA